ncbi:MAG: 3'-5' exonuclease, partial [Muribaculaceae bacterium]|nr:3'-5' exonuclease [Muribaculaceae bacterium]
TDEDVKNEPTFRQIANSLAQLIAVCDIAGFNSNRFDVPLLDAEFERVGVDLDLTKARFIDVQTIYHKKEPRTLSAAYKYYCGEELEGAHGANADTVATMKVLMAQLERYDDLPTEVGALSEFASNNRNVDIIGRLIYDDQDREIINFGKYKGQVAAEVLKKDPGYYSWIMAGDFPRTTKAAFTRIKLRK